MKTTTRRIPGSRSLSAILGLSLAFALACDPDGGPEGALVPRDGPGSGGPWQNTNVIDTAEVDAIDTQGLALDGVTLQNVIVMLSGGPATIDPGSLAVVDGTVRATVGGASVSGKGFTGSVWIFDASGTPLTATLTTVETSDDAGLWDPITPDELLKLDPDRLVYTFTYDIGSGPLATCAEDSAAGARAVLYGDLTVNTLSGDITSRPNTIYFGCISGAVGKAALHGYAPDSPSEPSVSLDMFETAVRAVRADYCGDGTSYTNVGNRLTYKDREGINTHTEASYTTEALWNEGGGARCVNRRRDTGATLLAPLACAGGSVPLCGTEANVSSRWTSGTGELWTKIPPL
ncbi:MAG: hypothetical protein H6710_11035 [Myxococcales bacterium]|nr:hypothetical protein [Myxococcales bacterium]